jgi:nucleotide-binding universal stress UspA family protein
MFERILVATDGSPLSKKAAAGAIELAAVHGSVLLVMTVVPRYARTYLDGADVYNAEDIALIEKQWDDNAQSILDEISRSAAASGVRVETLTVNADLVAEAIIAAATEHKCDLIVMASHGRKGIQRLLLGSETQHVLTHSSLPVLVLR